MMSGEVQATVRGILSDILGVDTVDITPDTSQRTVESWDSANHLALVFALETEFGIAFDVNEIESMVDFPKIVEMIQAKV
jgi:acyl carrier protein